jgi:hypothetical protein
MPYPSCCTPDVTRYPLHGTVGGPQGQSGCVWKISSLKGFDTPAHSTSLYGLHYPSHCLLSDINIMTYTLASEAKRSTLTASWCHSNHFNPNYQDLLSAYHFHLVNKTNLVHNFSCMFISILYMFRATMCPSSGEITVSMRLLVFVTLCGWPSGMQDGIPSCITEGHLHRVTNTRCHIDTVISPDDGHTVAWNMQRIETNIKQKLCTRLVLFTRLYKDVWSTKHKILPFLSFLLSQCSLYTPYSPAYNTYAVNNINLHS